jgi:hypothetical protein
MIQKKSDSEVKMMGYLNEIKNHTGITPSIIHTDRGGEFGSPVFKAYLSQRGIALEQGAADFPQTNGCLAERFNQLLLVKIRCMLAQSSVPLNYWDEAAKLASSLINMLPSLALGWKSPNSILEAHRTLIEPVRHVHTLIPFGLKVHVHTQLDSSIILPSSKPLLFLGYQPRSDAMRFLDPISRRIVISRDYTPFILSFPYKSKSAMKKLPATLPTSSAESVIEHGDAEV